MLSNVEAQGCYLSVGRIEGPLFSLISKMNKRLHAYYSGSVHGVGFRYTAERTALSLNVTGWVKNLKDGRVELLCEGEEGALKEFIQKIDAIFKVYIENSEFERSKATGEFDGFDIRF